jgi:hypothetical protein
VAPGLSSAQGEVDERIHRSWPRIHNAEVLSRSDRLVHGCGREARNSSGDGEGGRGRDGGGGVRRGGRGGGAVEPAAAEGGGASGGSGGGAEEEGRCRDRGCRAQPGHADRAVAQHRGRHGRRDGARTAREPPRVPEDAHQLRRQPAHRVKPPIPI